MSDQGTPTMQPGLSAASPLAKRIPLALGRSRVQASPSLSLALDRLAGSRCAPTCRVRQVRSVPKARQEVLINKQTLDLPRGYPYPTRQGGSKIERCPGSLSERCHQMSPSYRRITSSLICSYIHCTSSLSLCSASFRSLPVSARVKDTHP